MADEQKAAPSVRKQLQLKRMEKIREAKAGQRVRVLPRDDEVRAAIKHPRAGAFRSTDSLEWPNDDFTQRRLRDGTVMLEAPRNNPPTA